MVSQQNADRGERASEPPPTPSAPTDPPAAAKVEVMPRPEVAVERVTHQDVNEVCALYKRVWDAQKGDLKPEMIKAWQPAPLEFTRSMEGVSYFAARRDSKMVGAIGCQTSDGSCRIVHLAVDADQRRQGVASALAHSAIEWARHSNCHSVWVDAPAKLESAASAFLKLGFQECGVFHRHYFTEDVKLFEMVL